MSTLVVGEQPFMAEWLSQRQALGHDHRDEVWGGVLHVLAHASVAHARVATQVLRALGPLADERGLLDVGEFNLGEPSDSRVPDGGWLAPEALSALYSPTAVAVLEVLSPQDETFAKLAFYAARGVREVLVADPGARTVHCYRRDAHDGAEANSADGWRTDARSAVFGCSMDWLVAQVRWP